MACLRTQQIAHTHASWNHIISLCKWMRTQARSIYWLNVVQSTHLDLNDASTENREARIDMPKHTLNDERSRVSITKSVAFIFWVNRWKREMMSSSNGSKEKLRFCSVLLQTKRGFFNREEKTRREFMKSEHFFWDRGWRHFSSSCYRMNKHFTVSGIYFSWNFVSEKFKFISSVRSLLT